jgi:hypothetical protein
MFRKPEVEAAIRVADMTMDNYNLGTLDCFAELKQPQNEVYFHTNLTGNNSLLLKGNYYLNNKKNRLSANLSIDKLSVKPVEKYLTGIASNLIGEINGNIEISGNPSSPILDGNLKVNKMGMKVDFLNTAYIMPELKIALKKDLVEIQPSIMKDKYNNKGIISGKVKHKYFRNIRMDTIMITTENLLFVETTRSQSQGFYGTVFAGGAVALFGGLKDLTIAANVQTQERTVISIPITSDNNVTRHDFIVFIDPKADSVVEDRVVEKANLNIQLFVDIEPTAEVELVMDMQEGDVIRAKGNGNILLDMNNRGKFEITGKYVLDKGQYALELQNLINKDFVIESGSSITFAGDPYDAILDIRAIYHVKKASKYDLVRDYYGDIASADDKKEARKHTPVDVILILTEKLSTPNIAFDIEVPSDAGPSLTTFDQKLREIRSDPDELNKQVFSLLVLNRFIPADAKASDQVRTGVNTTVSEFLSSQISNYLSEWTNLDIDIAYRPYEALNETGNPEDADLRQELTLALTQKLFNDRVAVNIQGNFDFGQSSTIDDNVSSTSNIAGDFELEYYITPDGRVRVRAFRKSDFDVISEKNQNKTGVGIFLKKEFDNAGELFRRSEKGRRKKNKIKKDEPE